MLRALHFLVNEWQPRRALEGAYPERLRYEEVISRGGEI
jgi:hypothetical protein